MVRSPVLHRSEARARIRRALRRQRAVALVGPRQCGGTTLGRQLVDPESPNDFDLEDPTSLARLADPARFLVLGSASPQLLRQSTETLARRLEAVTLQGFALGEVGTLRLPAHWRRGGFPRSFLARSEGDSRVVGA